MKQILVIIQQGETPCRLNKKLEQGWLVRCVSNVVGLAATANSLTGYTDPVKGETHYLLEKENE